MTDSRSKLMSLSEAVERFVPDGSEVVMGTCLESLIPFAAGHEIIRQEKRMLTLVGPISDMLFDQVIGGGCVARVRAAWVGNVITGSGYNFRQAVEGNRLSVEDHTNLTMALALRAGAMGVGFMPARTALGSDLYRTNPGLKVITCPFTGETLTAVAAITPHTAVVHVQKADELGNTHAWGNLGVTREACLASGNVIVTAEEIVRPDVIAADPNRVIMPGFRVSAVVHAPWGAHPSPVPGHYNRDHQVFIDYRNASRTPEGFRAWKAAWVDGVTGFEDYLRRLGEKHTAALKIGRHALSERVDYGY